jgi:hypothetical protein
LSFGLSHRVTPNIIFGKAQKEAARRHPNDASRSREYLTPEEVKRMVTAARAVPADDSPSVTPCSSRWPIGTASELIIVKGQAKSTLPC